MAIIRLTLKSTDTGVNQLKNDRYTLLATVSTYCMYQKSVIQATINHESLGDPKYANC